jgi:crotonobetainyl-CoA:carnitine CoA-transferase CaiB-like acyl-CoA transferase
MVKISQAPLPSESEFYANLAEDMPEGELSLMGSDLCELVEKDKEARKRRDEQYEEGIKRTGLGDDAPGGGPQRVGVPIIDLTTGMYASIAVCAAIANRAVTGKGQWIDVSLLDSCVAFLANQAMNYFATGESPKSIGNAHPNIVPYQTFKTSDGALILACGNDNLFKKFCEIAECTHLSQDPRYATNGERVKNRVEITAILDEIFLKHTTREWVKLLDEAGVANGPINTVAQVFEEPQVLARGMKIELPHAVAGTVPLVGSPMKFSGTPIKHEIQFESFKIVNLVDCRQSRYILKPAQPSQSYRRIDHLL